MSPLDSGYAGPHPDLRRQACDMFNGIGPEWSERHRPERPAVIDDVTLHGQRTWRDLDTIHAQFNGCDLSVALISIAIGERNYPWIVAVGRRPGEADWRTAGAAGGGDEATDYVGGHLGGSWYLCVGCYDGHLGMLRGIHAIEIEQANGEVATGQMEDDRCVIAFALMNAPRSENHPITMRYLDADSDVIYSQVW